MPEQINNAAPIIYNRGTRDSSSVLVPREELNIPQHLPKFYLFTEKGSTYPQLVTAAERVALFGPKTFDPSSKYFNHSTLFSNAMAAEGNLQMIQRLNPNTSNDPVGESNIILWMQLKKDASIPVYTRDSVTGKINYDANGDKIVDGNTTTAGYEVEWSLTNNTGGTLGELDTIVVDSTEATLTVKYPVLQLKASSFGEFGNLAGLRIWAPTKATDDNYPKKLLSEEKVFPYRISLIRKENKRSIPKVVKTIFGDNNIPVVLKSDVSDPDTDASLSIKDTLIQSYQNIDDLRFAKVFGDFGEMYLYEDNVNTILGTLYTAEEDAINTHSDIVGNDNTTKGLINIISLVSSNNVEYKNIVLSDDSILFGKNTNILAKGGSDGSISNADGTVNDTLHSELVSTQVKRYADKNDEVQELAENVESVMYDTGFLIQTKKDMCSLLAHRKDLRVELSTHQFDDGKLTNQTEYSIAISLRTVLRNYPDSEYYGTEVFKGKITGRSGKALDSTYKKRLPLTYELAIKNAQYMGAGNGRWKEGRSSDGAPGSIIGHMYDFNITWVPVSSRRRNWEVGMNWIQKFDRNSYFFPAHKTIFTDDTSVLNSVYLSAAICELNKVVDRCWKTFTGVSNLTNTQLVTRVNEFIVNNVKGRFDNRFIIIPGAFISDLDKARGFSWTLPIQIQSPNMKTVMTTYIEARRLDDS